MQQSYFHRAFHIVFIACILSAAAINSGAQGVITTFAGTDYAFPGDGGPATQAPLAGALGLSVSADSKGNFYIADGLSHRVMKVGPDGILRVVAGNGIGAFSGDGGPATSGSLLAPQSVAVDSSGNLYIADAGNNDIRKVTPDGIISTIAGNGTQAFSGDGGPAIAASISFPETVAVDSAGNLYIASVTDSRIRKVTPDGIIQTVAGNGREGFSGDGGPATSASLDYPQGMAVDAAGNLYIAATLNFRIRKVSPSGIISTGYETAASPRLGTLPHAVPAAGSTQPVR